MFVADVCCSVDSGEQRLVGDSAVGHQCVAKGDHQTGGQFVRPRVWSQLFITNRSLNDSSMSGLSPLSLYLSVSSATSTGAEPSPVSVPDVSLSSDSSG